MNLPHEKKNITQPWKNQNCIQFNLILFGIYKVKTRIFVDN